MNEETAQETAMRVPAHGRGQLLSGGKPGNKGGGRRPERYRIMARRLLEERGLLPRMANIAEGKVGEIHTERDAEGNWVKEYCETPLREQRGAFDSLAKIGIPQAKEVSLDHVRERLSTTLDIIRKRLSPEQAEALINELEPVWR